MHFIYASSIRTRVRVFVNSGTLAVSTGRVESAMGSSHLYMRNQRANLHVEQVLGQLLTVITAAVFILTVIAGVQCISAYPLAPASQAPTAPTPERQNFSIFSQYEADAMKEILKNWTTLNPQLSTILKWSPFQYPCNSSMSYNYSNTKQFQGAWSGVYCTLVLLESNGTGDYYAISTTSLILQGSNSSCNSWFGYEQCGFEGIKGVLPSEISRLRNLSSIVITNSPELTGPIPLEIWQMSDLTSLVLSNNSLVGTLPSNAVTASSQLYVMELNNNSFSGNLQVSSQGTLFSSTLGWLDVSFNQLDGPVDFQRLNASRDLKLLDLNNNRFSGTFSTGPYFDPGRLDMSNNKFTGIRFENYTDIYGGWNLETGSRGPGTVYMPTLSIWKASGNRLKGPFPPEILQIPLLNDLDLSKNNFFGSIDFRGIEETFNLTYLNISYNNFNDTFFVGPYFNPISLDMSNNYFKNVAFDTYNGTTSQVENIYMPLLKTLYFQYNKLNGKFPAQILTAPNLTILDGGHNVYKTLQLPDIPFENSTLISVGLTYNCLQDVQYPTNPGRFSTSNLQVSNLLFLGGNPICSKVENTLLSTICRMSRTSSVLDVLSKSNTKNKVIMATSTSIPLLVLVLVAAFFVWRLRQRIKSLHVILEEFERREVKPNLYSYKEIKLATNNFDKTNKLGEGGFGVVYKGKLFDGTVVAIKKLTKSSGQVLSEFLNEVAIISSLKHRNLVKLKGCCLGDGEQRILVFEYVENGSLAHALFIKGDSKANIEPLCLDWETRFNIVVGTARGLAYLHEDLQPPVIHRDIKAHNILLDKNYNPKIADFGLAYFFPSLENKASHLTLTQVAGTRGYWSPEYALQGHMSTALDVYSFGIMVLETISGRKAIDPQKSHDEVELREWAWRQFELQTTTMLIDPKMMYTSIQLEAIVRIVNVALLCVHHIATKRPKMFKVVPMLLGSMPVGEISKGFEYGEVERDVVANSSISFHTSLGLEIEEI